MFCVGRAGRYGSKFPEGAVTCLDKEDLPLLHHSLATLTCPLEVKQNLYEGLATQQRIDYAVWLKKVGVASKVSHGLGWSFLNLL